MTDAHSSAPRAAPRSIPAPGLQRTAWWLTTRRRRPEWQSLAVTGLATFSGRPRANFESAQPGDPVLIYVARPDQAIRAVGVITHAGAGPLPAAPEAAAPGEDGAAAPRPPLHIEVQFAFEVPNPLPWSAIHRLPELAEAEPVKQRSSGALFYLSPTEYATLQARICERNPELAAAFATLDSGEPPIPAPAHDGAAEPAPLRPGPPSIRERPAAYQATPPRTRARPRLAARA